MGLKCNRRDGLPWRIYVEFNEVCMESLSWIPTCRYYREH